MKLINPIVFLFFAIVAAKLSAQEKSIYYYNQKAQPLNQVEFIQLSKDPDRFEKIIEVDSAFFIVSYLAKIKGTLDTNQMHTLKTSLSANSPITLNSEAFIAIDYKTDEAICNSEQTSTWNIYDRDYLKKLNKIHPAEHLYMYKKNDTEILKFHHEKRLDWIKDPENLVKELFFSSQPYLCYSFVIIAPNGNYISYHTEYGKHDVWKMAQELHQLSQNNN